MQLITATIRDQLKAKATAA